MEASMNPSVGDYLQRTTLLISAVKEDFKGFPVVKQREVLRIFEAWALESEIPPHSNLDENIKNFVSSYARGRENCTPAEKGFYAKLWKVIDTGQGGEALSPKDMVCMVRCSALESVQ